MREQLSASIKSVVTIVIFLVVALTPLLFLDLTTEFFETPKLILLIGATLLLVVLWALSWIIGGKVLITWTPVHLPLLLFLLVILISTFVNSDSRFLSLFGNFPRLHNSATTWVAYVLFFFVVASNIRNLVQIRVLYFILLISSVVVAVVSLMSYFGVYLPLAFAKSQAFTPTGSSFSTTSMLALLLPFTLFSIVNPNKVIPLPISLALSTLFAVTIALLGPLSVQVVAILALILVIITTKKNTLSKTLPLLLIPLAVSLIIFGLSLISLGGRNMLYQKAQSFPKEIQIPFTTSWKVSASAFRDNPFFGTGPATYLNNFTVYKPAEQNLKSFWNIRFDTAYNEPLQALGTLGALGITAFLFLIAVILNFGWKGLGITDQEVQGNTNNINHALAASAILFVVLLLLHISTPVLMIDGLTLLAMLMASHKQFSGKVSELSVGIKTSRITDSNVITGDLLPVIVFIPILILGVIGAYFSGKFILADYHHRIALNSASTKGIDTYNSLIKAEQLNPYIDLYRTDLAQTNFALANAIANAKKGDEASPSGSLTDSDKQNIRQLLSQAIREAQVATVINPNSAQNWEILASIYRNISGVAENAMQLSLDSYGRAIQRDPLNPLLRLNVGGVYYSIKNYDLAIRFFSDSVNLKPDYPNAWYNLSVALRDKGDLKASQQAAERVVSLIDASSPDYKTASEYLADLKARAATGSAQNSEIKPPAAEQSGALQQEELPKVLDLPRQDNIATPEAVKKETTEE